jgi:hypothetical protein
MGAMPFPSIVSRRVQYGVSPYCTDSAPAVVSAIGAMRFAYCTLQVLPQPLGWGTMRM